MLEKRPSMFRGRQMTNYAENLPGTLAASRRQVCEEERRTEQPDIPPLFKGSSARPGAQVNSYGTIRNAIRGSKYLLKQMESPRKPNTV